MLEQEILAQLQLLNQNFEKSKRPLYKSFLSGFLHSLGAALGTILIWGISIWVFSLFSKQILASSVKIMETMMASINWDKIIPKPKLFEVPSGFNLKDLNLEQLTPNPQVGQ